MNEILPPGRCAAVANQQTNSRAAGQAQAQAVMQSDGLENGANFREAVTARSEDIE